jgi:macrodomain Ter protein organizer (MatP/YcbG family)
MRLETWSVKQGKKGLYREKITIRLPFEIVRALEGKAKERGLSLSDVIRLYIEQGLKNAELKEL